MRADGTQSVPGGLGHNVWSGGALPVVVTCVAWVALGTSLLLLFLSPEAAAAFFLESLHYEQLFYCYADRFFWACTWTNLGQAAAS